MQKEKITKSKLIELAKKSQKLNGFFEYDDKSFTINNVYGEFMQKQEPQITLKHIHELVVGLNRKIDNLETKVDNLETKVDKLETKVDKLETKVDKLETETKHRLNQIEKRLDKLEG